MGALTAFLNFMIGPAGVTIMAIGVFGAWMGGIFYQRPSLGLNALMCSIGAWVGLFVVRTIINVAA